MRRILCAALLAALPAFTAEPLPVPLQLPPGLRQVLPIEPRTSYMGDILRIADCPEDKFNPFGSCGNELFGGPAIYVTPLSGTVQARFYPPVKDVAHFEIDHPSNLSGPDTRLRAPQLYRLPVRDNFIFDALAQVCQGDLNLVTGEVTNLKYDVNFFNSFYIALAEVNPRLAGGSFQFPGFYGSADLKFEQRPDGLLDLSFRGSTFLPLSNQIEGDPVRIPMAGCGAGLRCDTIQAPGSSLHPQLVYTTKLYEPEPCGERCPDLPSNATEVYTVNSLFSTVADRFTMAIPALGGNRATARAHLQGRVLMQFGERRGSWQPFLVRLLPPAGLLAVPPESPLSVLGITLGLFGHDGLLAFPNQTYHFRETFIANDPLDLALGVADMESGRSIGGLLTPNFFLQTLLLTVIEQNNGRIAPSAFKFWGPATFERGSSGQTLFRFDSDTRIPFEGFVWPHPSGERARAFLAGPGSELNPIFRVQAMRETDVGRTAMRGSAQNLVSAIGDRFSYSYDVTCGMTGANGAFEYTNASTTSRRGTFVMENLAAVDCLNQRGTDPAPGTFDTVVFSGFGRWSEDDDRHLATVQVAPGYVSILIDAGLLSNASTPPAELPLP